MNRTFITRAAAVAVVLTVAAGCQGTTTGSGGSAASPTGVRETVPKFVGMGLQSAQDAARKAGFRSLTSHDSLGRGRAQILDRDWKVCFQNVAEGSVTPTGTKLDFGVVKTSESCPAHDQVAPASVGGVMPDFRGKSVKAARSALGLRTIVVVKDATSAHRVVLIASNWQVCTQKPAAGASLSGETVTLTAVKFGESCP